MIKKLGLGTYLLALLAWIALLAWSSTETLHVVVTAKGNQLEATVGNVTVDAPAAGPPAGQVGFFLQGEDPRATVVWPTSGTAVPFHPDPTDLLYRLGAESAWTNVRITNLGTGATVTPSASGGWHPFFGDWFADPLGGETTATPGLALVGPTDWYDYRIEADVLRPRAASGVLVRSPDGTNGLLFYFRPEDRDLSWFQLRDGAWYGPLASAPYRAFALAPISAIQDVLRLLLGGLPVALAIVGIAWAAGRVGSFGAFGTFGTRSTRNGAKPTKGGWGEDGAGGDATVVLDNGPTDGGAVLVRAPGAGDSRFSDGGSVTPSRDPNASTTGYAGDASVIPSRGEESPDHFPRSNRPGDSSPRLGITVRGAGSLLVPNILALLIVLAGLALTLNVADSVLQRMPHVQDSVAYLFQAKTFALGRLWVPVPPMPRFFVHEFVVMTPDGRWFSKYPPGWPMVLALGVLANAPWVVDPVCGAISLGLLYLIGRDIYERPRVGLLAAILGLFAPFWIFLSGSMMAHTSGLMFTLLGVYGLWLAEHRTRFILPSILAGLGFGMALLIRPYTALVIVVPFALHGLWVIARERAVSSGRANPTPYPRTYEGRGHERKIVLDERRPPHSLPPPPRGGKGSENAGVLDEDHLGAPRTSSIAGREAAESGAGGAAADGVVGRALRYGPALVAVAPFVAWFFLYNKLLTGSFLLPPQELWWAFDKVGFGPDHGPWGYYPIDALNNTSRNLLELLSHGFGWPTFVTLSLAVVPFVARRARTWDWLFLFGFLAVVVGYAFWWADGIMYGPRFYFEGFGFLILLTARGVDVTMDLAAGSDPATADGRIPSQAIAPAPLATGPSVDGPASLYLGERVGVKGHVAQSEISSHPNPLPEGEGTGVAPALALARGRELEAPDYPLMSRASRPGRIGLGAVLPLLLVAGLIAYNLAFYMPGQWKLYHGYNYTNHGKLDAVAAAGIHHALVFADVGPEYAWWEYGMVFSANDPLLQGDVIYARDLGDPDDCQLVPYFPGRTLYKLNGTTVTPFTGCPAGSKQPAP